jgi:aminopeptidase N
MTARDYVALVCAGLPKETDINLVTATIRQAQSAVSQFADPAWAPTGWAMIAETAQAAVGSAEPGSGFQLAWARALGASARRPEELAVLRGWLDGVDVPTGLAIDTELRWSLLSTLVAHGAAGPDDIEAELNRDRTASGERAAALAHALVPTAESKAETWRRLTGDEKLPNWLQRSMLQGFHHTSQLALTEPYRQTFFDIVDEIWATRDSEEAQEFVYWAYPSVHVSPETVALTDEWLAAEGHAPGARRLVAEGRDGVVRALAARAKDAAS